MSMTPVVRAATTLVAATALAAALAACSVTPVPAPTATDPAPTVDPTPVAAPAGSRPDARTDTTCAGLIDPAALSAPFSAAVVLAGPERTQEWIGTVLSDAWTVRQAGGLACEWSTPDSLVTSEGWFGYEGVQLRLLPATPDEWAQYSGGQAVVEECYADSCTIHEYLPNGWWMTVRGFDFVGAFGGDPSGQVGGLQAALRAPVAALAAPVEPWSPPAPEIDLAGGCDAVIAPAAITAAFGLPDSGVPQAQGGDIGEYFAQESTGATACRWLAADSFTLIAYVEALPGGAWAMTESLAAAPAPASPVAVAGHSGDAFLRDHVDFAVLEMDLGGTWVKISAPTAEPVGTSGADTALAIAARIVADHPAP